uniref:Y5 protein n=1 Tax=Parastrongyloides trichosuri TaxID=131310 RepID=A0A0N4ZN40_PARTI
MLGVEFLHESGSKYCSVEEKCAYIQVDIPDLIVGYAQGCSNSIFNIINDLSYIRKDFYNEMGINFIEESYNLCHEDKIYYKSGKVLSGNFYFYISCANDLDNILKIDVPPLNNIPGPTEIVNCKGNDGNVTCSEGFCTYYNIVFNDTMRHVSVIKDFYGCPSDFYNTLYNIQEEFALPNLFFFESGKSCSQRTNSYNYEFFMENIIYFYQSCDTNINIISNQLHDYKKNFSIENIMYGECYYLVNGYFSQTDEDIGNIETLCDTKYCVTLTINEYDTTGLFMGCSSDLNQYLNVINKKQKNLFGSKIDEYIEICNNGETLSINYENNFSMSINCNNSIKSIINEKILSTTNKEILPKYKDEMLVEEEIEYTTFPEKEIAIIKKSLHYDSTIGSERLKNGCYQNTVLFFNLQIIFLIVIFCTKF